MTDYSVAAFSTIIDLPVGVALSGGEQLEAVQSGVSVRISVDQIGEFFQDIVPGVTSFSAGSTGLTPAGNTEGPITLGGTLNAASGGTGLSSYTVGSLLYASSNTTLAGLSAVAAGNVLLATGLNLPPQWGQVSLATAVSGVLDVGHGGTGSATLASNGLLYGSGTAPVGQLAPPGVAGQVLISTVSGPPQWAVGAAPSGTAGGDLAGSYPNPTIKPSAINGQVLTTVAGLSQWATPAAGTLTGITAGAGITVSGSAPSPIVGITNSITAGGPTGSATVAPIITYNTQGQLTAVSSATITPAVGSITGLAAGMATWLATPSSANLAATVTDETGTGALVFGTGPTISNANLTGTPTVTGYLPLAGGTLTGTLTGTNINASVGMASPIVTSTATLVLNAATGSTISQRINNVPTVTTQDNAMFPATTNTIALGASTNRWSTVASVLGDFSGVITAPTATPGTNTTQLATTAFVAAAMATAFVAQKFTKFTASGTFTPDSKCICGYAVVKGGGSSGGSYTTAAGFAMGMAGGGEGGTAIKYFTKAQVSPTVAVTVGAGGTAGAGGTSSFGALAVATGGGASNGYTGGLGGSGTTGDLTFSGDAGGSGMNMQTTNTPVAIGGSGGGTGGGIGGVIATTGANGGSSAPANSGGGGGGSAVFNTATTPIPGNGGNGICYVVEYLGP